MWLWIFENGDHPIHDKNTTNFIPDAELWQYDKHYRYHCYILSGDLIYYGYYYKPNAFRVIYFQDLEKTYKAYKNRLSEMYTAQDLQEMEAYGWIYLDQRKPEKFCEDTEIIDEGVITIIKYFDNNSIESKEIIDLETGECIYYMRWTRSQYYSEKHERELYALTEYEKRLQEKAMKLSTQWNDRAKQYKWVIDFPISLKGYSLDQILRYRNN